jgi:exosortase
MALAQYSLGNDSASHILVIPFIAAGLLYFDRRKLPRFLRLDLPAALPFALGGVVLGAFSYWAFGLSEQTGLSFFTLGFLLLLIAGFVASFGRAAAKSVWFALAFLGFAVLLPERVLDWFIYELQAGSAWVAAWIFDLTGVPALRDGFWFHLAGWNVEVAKECSGIRSSIALVIVAVLVAHFSFTKMWKKVVFVAAGLAMMIVKNGVRIATLTILAKYVDPGFLFGRLHHEGGVVFFLIGLALLAPVYWILRREDALALSAQQREAIIEPRSFPA